MWKNIQEQLNSIYDALVDIESKEWFESRVQYMIDRDGNKFSEEIQKIDLKFPKKWRNTELEGVIDKNQDIIIYGCGHDGKTSRNVLNMLGYDILCWCDSNYALQNCFVDNKMVISPEELAEKYKNCLLIIGSKKYEQEIRVRLNDVSFPAKNIFRFVYSSGVNLCGNQYFDVFQPDKKEVFVDAGAYNGDTIEKFIHWKKDKNYKVYCIEPSMVMCQVIKNKKFPNVEVFNYAAWSKNTDLSFNDDLRGGLVMNIGGGYTCKRKNY